MERATATCPLCGIGKGGVAGRARNQQRLRGLLQAREALRSGSKAVKQVVAQRDQLCSDCSTLLTALSAEEDRLELLERLDREINGLE